MLLVGSLMRYLKSMRRTMFQLFVFNHRVSGFGLIQGRQIHDHVRGYFLFIGLLQTTEVVEYPNPWCFAYLLLVPGGLRDMKCDSMHVAGGTYASDRKETGFQQQTLCAGFPGLGLIKVKLSRKIGRTSSDKTTYRPRPQTPTRHRQSHHQTPKPQTIFNLNNA